MSYFTELHIGLYNAWIGSLVACLSGTIVMIVNRKAGKRLANMSWYTKKELAIAVICFIMQYSFIVFSVWVPLKLNTPWFYAGLVFFIFGLMCYLVALYDYAVTPEDAAVTTGLYKISRNPLYLFYSFMGLALCVASASLPLFLVWIIYNIPTHFIILGEEKYCLNTYGEQFADYMTRVPRYFLFF